MVILTYNGDTDLYLPSCFILCSHKNKEIYRKIFRYIAEDLMMNDYQFQKITVDFEESLKEGAQGVFKNVIFIGCKFHFNQAIIRKAHYYQTYANNSI